VAPDAKRLALARRAVAKGRAWRGRGDVWFTPEPLLTPSAGGQLAFVFPGLEAEFTPRLAEVAQHFRLPYTETEGAVVGDVARHGIGVLAVGRVLDSALRALGIEPDAVAGHSIGEWSAMLAGGLYDTSTADELLAGFDPDALRVPGVVFAALGAPAHQVEGWLGRRSDVVLSHDNAPGQAMICGPRPAVEEVVQEAREQRIVAQILPFRSGFHTPMLAPYLGPLTEGVRRAPVREARVPVWSGTTAEPFPAAPEEVRELFVRHLVEPVRFRQLTESMYAAGCRAFVQVGGGQLGSLIADTLHSRDVLTVAAGASRRGGLAQLRRVVSALWSEGRPGAGAALSRGLASSDSAASAASLRPARGALSRPSVPPVRLDLGAASVSLPHPVRSELRAELLAALGRSSKSGETDGRLDGLAERFPAVAELRAALTETAETAVTLFAGAGQRRDSTTTGGRTVELTPQPVAARAGTPAAGSPGRTGLPPAEARVIPLWDGVAPRGGIPAGGGTPAVSGSIASGGGPADGGASTDGAAPADGGGHEPACRSHLRVSVDEMPYLIDHCFIPQRPGWPELSDRHPVVPATTALRHMMDAAERAFPGRRAIAAYDVRFEKWLTAEPATLVEAVVTPEPDSSRVRVNFGPYARAVLELAEVYPERPRTPWRCGQAERACEIDAADLYRDRWMFHGPAFQGVTQLTGIGDAHIRGTITVPTAPGALLDNVGQLLGYWILAQHTERRVVFPVGMRGFRFFGPEPPPGTEVECHVKITSITRSVLTADIQLVKDGTVWAQITGWQDRRFTVMSADLPGGYPERLALSEARLGGWTLLTDRWHDLASRGLAMRTHLGAAERAAFGGHPPRGRRQWLLGRIAAKDAVRHWLWQQGEGAVFPAEIEIRNDSEGQPYAVGVHGRDLPPLDLSLAHKADAAVALVRPSAEREHPDTGVGIDIELVTERTEATHRIALNAQERELLAELGESAGEGEEVWFTRFWAAKEAAAKAEGHGLRGRPREFTVLSASPYGLLVDSRRQRHHVRCEHITTSVPGSPHHRYVVAWTTKEYSL
jgi:malonyl CoA-acyl carrier protein transacylase/phosphopantetheinyl transferase